MFLATGGGIGYSPVAPGTVASLCALLIVWLLPFASLGLLLAVALATGVGGWAAGRTERLLGRRDPSAVVIDEIAGMWLSVVALPRWPLVFLAAFLLFRLFDIAKPFPIRQSEKFSGGLGIMLDDLIAGVYTLAVLWGLLAVLGRGA